ncbi:MAG: YaaA family protein [Campylobacterales bacterium]|nr:YaaA family protein [Campylobacterales bacterium]
MYILFSPSEGKKEGGTFAPLREQSLLFPSLYEKRLPLVRSYDEAMLHGSLEELQKLTGIKKEEEIRRYQESLFSSPTMAAIERYDGVAYDYLDLASLAAPEKTYLYEQCIIFSNLFGPIRAGDAIPSYKFKQGQTLGAVATEKVYKQEFSSALDELFKDELILDLRAGFYEKFYALKRPFVTMKFLKEGKVVSHWAKAYRGKVLRTLAQIQPKNEEQLLAIAYEGLRFVESVEYKKGKMLVFEVVEQERSKDQTDT